MEYNQIEVVAAVIDFVEENLCEKIDLTIVADAVHYSKYHLHRMFTETVGLTVHDYVIDVPALPDGNADDLQKEIDSLRDLIRQKDALLQAFKDLANTF